MAQFEQGDLLKIDGIQQPVIVVRINFYTPLAFTARGITGYKNQQASGLLVFLLSENRVDSPNNK